jgi:hypothetical protein
LHNARFRCAGANGFFPSSLQAPGAVRYGPKLFTASDEEGVCCTKFPVAFTARPASQVWFNCKQRQFCHEVSFQEVA